MASIVSCTASRVAAAAGGGLAEPKGSKGPLPVVSLRVSPSSALAHAEPEKPAETDHALAVAGPRINTLSLRLRPGLQGFSAGSKASGVVFGDQELAENIKLQGLGESDNDYLHVFVESANVELVSVKTLMRELTLCNAALAALLVSQPAAPSSVSPRSALTEQLAAASPFAEQQPQQECQQGDCEPAVQEPCSPPDVVPAAAFGSLVPLTPAPGSPTARRAVIHLMVHKSAKVAWHQLRDEGFELSISSSDTIDSLFARLEAAGGISLSDGRHQVVHNGEVLASGRPLSTYGVGKGSVLELVPLEPPGSPVMGVASGAAAHVFVPPVQAVSDAPASPPPSSSSLAPLPLSSPAHALHEHWLRARAGLADGQAPALIPAGTGGSYFLSDPSGAKVCVFKPADEEPGAANNPKNRVPASASGEGVRRGSLVGEGALREVAAYLLDHEHFAGVPPTALVSAYVGPNGGANGSADCGGQQAQRELKMGSLQLFVDAQDDCEERGVSGLPVGEVHKIAVLDLRLGNTDRNGGNILLRQAPGGGWQLVPIDHGYTLPASFEDLSYEWLYWPQAEQAFDERTSAYIGRLDAEADLALLAAAGIELRPECRRVFRVLTMLLQKAAARALTPYQIASIASRAMPSHRSPLEKLHTNALQLTRAMAPAGAPAGAPVDDAAYLTTMSRLMDEYLEEFLLEGEDLLL